MGEDEIITKTKTEAIPSTSEGKLLKEIDHWKKSSHSVGRKIL